MDQEFLWSLSDHFFKNFAEVASVQIQSLSHIFYGNGKRIILRDKGNGFIRIKLGSFSVLNSASGGGTCKQGVHDQIKVSDQMKGRGFGGTGSQMEQFTFQCFVNLMGGGDKTGDSVESPAVSRISFAFSPLNSTHAYSQGSSLSAK